jgi:hypothetical protein
VASRAIWSGANHLSRLSGKLRSLERYRSPGPIGTACTGVVAVGTDHAIVCRYHDLPIARCHTLIDRHFQFEFKTSLN